jgi:hypothetical protein
MALASLTERPALVTPAGKEPAGAVEAHGTIRSPAAARRSSASCRRRAASTCPAASRNSPPRTISAMSGSLTILPIPPRAVLDLVREDPHAALGIRPGAVLRLHHGLGHRRGHRGTALVVVLALGNLADEAVVLRLRRGAATYISWRWTKTMRAFGPSR